MDKHLRDLNEALKHYRLNLKILSHPKQLAWNSKIEVQCNECDLKMSKRLDSLKAGSGCRVCSNKKGFAAYMQTQAFADDMTKRSKRLTKTDKQYKTELKAVHGTSIQVIGKYRQHEGKTEHRCNVCKHKWKTSRTDMILQGHACPGLCKRQKIGKANTKPVELKRTLDPGYKKFRVEARRITAAVYTRFHKSINPKNLVRSYHGHHVDHIYSVAHAFTNPRSLARSITIRELCHPANLQMLSRKENHDKREASWITAAELRKNIREWNKLYGNPFKTIGGELHLV